jgi:hypothetical protein
MKRISQTLAVVLLLGCGVPEVTDTMEDAMARGYSQLECPGTMVGPVMGDLAAGQSVERSCWAVREAVLRAHQMNLIPQGALAVDSVAGAFVWMELVARSTADTSNPDTAYAVVLDLPKRELNVHVGGLGLDVEVGWIPKGLRY